MCSVSFKGAEGGKYLLWLFHTHFMQMFQDRILSYRPIWQTPGFKNNYLSQYQITLTCGNKTRGNSSQNLLFIRNRYEILKWASLFGLLIGKIFLRNTSWSVQGFIYLYNIGSSRISSENICIPTLLSHVNKSLTTKRDHKRFLYAH